MPAIGNENCVRLSKNAFSVNHLHWRKHKLRPFNFQLPPAVSALALQMLAIGSVMLACQLAAFKPTVLVFACASGVLASILSYFANLAKWWLPIQCLFAPALVLTLALDIHPGLFLAAFLVCILVFWNAANGQIPLYLSGNRVWLALEELLPPPNPSHGFTFVDVGSGLGGVLLHLAEARPDGNYHGIESAPLPCLWSWLRIRLGGHRQCRVYWGNLWDCDLSGYDVVFAFLSPAPMAKLWLKAKAEMKPGAVFVSSTFSVPGETPHQTIEVGGLQQTALLVWRL